ncbi:T9SS type A sorting domain-containing protein [bacterium]|nr:T9SS type A sorting domain-containing protein [bacterium]
MYGSTKFMALVLTCALLLSVSNAFATTFVFGEDGKNQDLTGSAASNVWTSADEFIIAGDCYVPDDATLTINQGVVVVFDYDYGGDFGSPMYPTLEVRGQLICEGTGTNRVWFTNEIPAVKGEYVGIKLNGALTYEGELVADYTVFEYGGCSTALIEVSEGGDLDLEDCYVRFSDTDGIFIDEDRGDVNIESCFIDSSDGWGIARSFVGQDESISALLIKDSDFIDNLGGGIQIQGFVEISGVNANGGSLGMYGNLTSWGFIRNCRLYNFAKGITFHSLAGQPPDEDLEISNIAIYNCTDAGFNFEDGDPQGELDFDMNIHNCVIWETVVGVEFDSHGEDVWPPGIDFNLNIIGSCWRGIEFPDDDPDVPANNAFKDNDTDFYNCDDDDANCIIDNGDDVTVILVSPDYPTADFHILLDDDNYSLIDVDDTAEDPDGSDRDCGLFGGEYADDFEYFSNSEFFIDLGPGDIDENLDDLPSTTYHLTEDFTVKAGRTYSFSDKALILVMGAYEFSVDGKLEAIADSEADSIIFRGYGEVGSRTSWGGIVFEESSEDNYLKWVVVTDAKYNHPNGITFEPCEGPPSDVSNIENVEVYNCEGWGIFISGSLIEVSIENPDIHHCEYGGISVSGSDDVIIEGGREDENRGLHHNGNELLTSAGLKISDSSCRVGGGDEDEEIYIYDNELFGLMLDDDTDADLDNGGGGVALSSNGEFEIRIDAGAEGTEFHYNNVEKDDGDDYVVNDDNLTDYWDVTNCWWDSAVQAEVDAMFANTTYVVYDPFAGAYIANINDFEIALRHMRNGEFAEAVPYFKSAVYSDPKQAHQKSSISFLMKCMKKAGHDLNDFRQFCTDVIENHPNEQVRDKAQHRSIRALCSMGRSDQALAEFKSLRSSFDNVVDSLRNEMKIALVELEYNCIKGDKYDVSSGERHSNAYFIKMERLEALETAAIEKGLNVKTSVPACFMLDPAYPNPFNATTYLSYSLPEAGEINLSLFDTNGRLMETLEAGFVKAGSHSLTLNAGDLPSGVYLVKLSSDDKMLTQQIVLLK